MAFDLCERFVGPMPIDLFLERFVPEAPTARPQGGFVFSKDSVSQNKKEFACPACSRGGKGNLAVLGDAVLSTPIVMSLVFGTPCPFIIEELRALFHDFYLFVSYQTGTGTGGRGDIRKPDGNRSTDSVGTQQVPILRRNLGYSREALELCLGCR